MKESFHEKFWQSWLSFKTQFKIEFLLPGTASRKVFVLCLKDSFFFLIKVFKPQNLISCLFTFSKCVWSKEAAWIIQIVIEWPLYISFLNFENQTWSLDFFQFCLKILGFDGGKLVKNSDRKRSCDRWSETVHVTLPDMVCTEELK